jgi:lipopolysaccharide cholinephosphotransferase
MVGGTLLGAVRHKGFIPWDDDLDIGLLREDYEKFLSVCKIPNMLSEKFYIQTWDNDEGYGYGFAKLRIKGTLYAEDISSNTTSKNGIYIDIFPFDNFPHKDNLKYNIIKFYFWSRLLLYKKGYKAWKKTFSRRAFVWGMLIVGIIFPNNYIKSRIIKIIMRDSKNNDRAINYFGCYKENDTVTISELENCKWLPFEGELLPAPSNYHDFLTNIYGDYMKLPPEENRYNRHKIIKLDFGNYIPTKLKS